MQQAAECNFEQLAMEVLRGILETVAERPDATEARQFSRHQATISTVMAFRPRDPLELMLAGQCVMFNHLLMDGTRELLTGRPTAEKPRLRPVMNATGNSFLRHLKALTRLKDRPVHEIAPLLAADRTEMGEPATAPDHTGPEQAASTGCVPPEPAHVATTPAASPCAMPQTPPASPCAIPATPAARSAGTSPVKPPAAADDPKIDALRAGLRGFAPVTPPRMDRSRLDPAAAAALAEVTRGPITPAVVTKR